MSDDHVTVMFTIIPESSVLPEPEVVVFCLCGWFYVTMFAEQGLGAHDLATGAATMKARDHVMAPEDQE